jgi:hypothetical protein
MMEILQWLEAHRQDSLSMHMLLGQGVTNSRCLKDSSRLFAQDMLDKISHINSQKYRAIISSVLLLWSILSSYHKKKEKMPVTKMFRDLLSIF